MINENFIAKKADAFIPKFLLFTTLLVDNIPRVIEALT